MKSTVTYIPQVHCVIDINLGKHVTATRQVVAEGRPYRVCDVHADLVERAKSIPEALCIARLGKTVGGAL